MTYLSCIVITMAADGMATQGAMVLAPMVLINVILEYSGFRLMTKSYAQVAWRNNLNQFNLF